MGSVRMPFGKHKGEWVEDIETGYLVWLLSLANLSAYLRQAVLYELENCRDDYPPAPQPVAATRPQQAMACVVKVWFREMSLQFHPDRGGHIEAMKALNIAHERLKELIEGTE